MAVAHSIPLPYKRQEIKDLSDANSPTTVATGS